MTDQTQHSSALVIEQLRVRPRDPNGILPHVYLLHTHQIDVLPLGTFLITVLPGDRGIPSRVDRVVKPDDTGKYSLSTLTPQGRLLLCFWVLGKATKSLRGVNDALEFRHIIQPGDDGFDLLDAFKIACDTRRAWAGKPVTHDPKLLLRALGLGDAGN